VANAAGRNNPSAFSKCLAPSHVTRLYTGVTFVTLMGRHICHKASQVTDVTFTALESVNA